MFSRVAVLQFWTPTTVFYCRIAFVDPIVVSQLLIEILLLFSDVKGLVFEGFIGCGGFVIKPCLDMANTREKHRWKTIENDTIADRPFAVEHMIYFISSPL